MDLHDKIYGICYKGSVSLSRKLIKNEDVFLGKAYMHFFKILLNMRNNPKLFYMFAQYINNNKELLKENITNNLANDIIFLLFADLLSNEETINITIKHFEVLFEVNYSLHLIF